MLFRSRYLDDPRYRNRGALEAGGLAEVSALVGPSRDEKRSFILKHQENATLTAAGSSAGIRGYEDIRLHSSSAAMVAKVSQATRTIYIRLRDNAYQTSRMPPDLH